MKNGGTPYKTSPQAGMASILITMITLIVISLIVLGFASIARKEQGRTLDRQLSTQAFYAAESGVEAARNVITAALKAGRPVPAKLQNCDAVDDTSYSPNYPSKTSGDIYLKADKSVAISCLNVNPTPDSLQYTGIGEDPTVVPVTATAAISRIEIVWKPATAPLATDQTTACPSTTNLTFSSTTSWACKYGVLNMQVTQTDPAVHPLANPAVAPISRQGLTLSTAQAMFEPTDPTGAGSLNYTTAVTAANGKANLLAANCGVAGHVYSQCTANITNVGAARSFTLRLVSLYQPSNVTVTAYSAGGTKLPLSGAQATVDSTGKAQDVLRRVQVRLPIDLSKGEVPAYAIQSNSSLCKRFQVTPTYFNIPGNFPTANPDTTNAMCKQTAPAYGTP